MIVQLTDVTVTYPNGVTAVSDINSSFEAGSFTVLLGPSGAGKSTLLRCLNGLVRPTRGDVAAGEGKSIFASSKTLRAHRQRTGMIFQQHHLIDRMTALQNVLTGRLSYYGNLRSMLPHSRADRLIALEALERVDLLERALHRADNLSGGQQQRVGIARALAQKPSIILADEPVASLDPETSVKVLSDLHRICREDKITAIVSLHQVDLARRFADRIIGVSGGRIVADDTPDALSNNTVESIYRVQSPAWQQAAE